MRAQAIKSHVIKARATQLRESENLTAAVDSLWFQWEQAHGSHAEYIEGKVAKAYASPTILNLFKHLFHEIWNRDGLRAVVSWITLAVLTAWMVSTDEHGEDLVSGIFSGALGQLASFFLLFFFQEGYNRWCKYYDLLVTSEGQLLAVVDIATASVRAIGKADDEKRVENFSEMGGDANDDAVAAVSSQGSSSITSSGDAPLTGEEFVREVWRLVSLAHLFYVTAMARRGLVFIKQMCAEFEASEADDELYAVPYTFRMLPREQRQDVRSMQR